MSIGEYINNSNQTIPELGINVNLRISEKGLCNKAEAFFNEAIEDGMHTIILHKDNPIGLAKFGNNRKILTPLTSFSAGNKLFLPNVAYEFVGSSRVTGEEHFLNDSGFIIEFSKFSNHTFEICRYLDLSSINVRQALRYVKEERGGSLADRLNYSRSKEVLFD